MSTAPDASHKYAVLDGLRGVAAIAVVLFHVHQAAPWLQRNAYLAVDLFFLLSGFVIAHAYERRLRAEMPVLAFLRVRAIRLWPLFALGCLLGLPTYLARAGLHHWAAALPGVAPNLFLLPAVPGASIEAYLFPIDVPAWSLLFEIVANIVYAMLVRRLTTFRLAAWVAVMAVAVIAAALHRGNLGGGDTWDSLASGFARVGFSFFAGVLLYRIRLPVPRLSVTWQDAVALLLMAILVAAFQFQPSAPWRWAGDVVFVLALSPLIVATGSALSVSPRLRWSCAQLGFVSYAIYVLHDPLASYVTALARGAHVATDVADPRLLALKIVIVLPAACAAAYIYDMPVRRWLSRRWRPGANMTTKTQASIP